MKLKDVSKDHTNVLKQQMKINYEVGEQNKMHEKNKEKESVGLKLESYQRNPRLEALHRDQKAVLAQQYRSGKVDQFSPNKASERYSNEQMNNKLLEVDYIYIYIYIYILV